MRVSCTTFSLHKLMSMHKLYFIFLFNNLATTCRGVACVHRGTELYMFLNNKHDSKDSANQAAVVEYG
jgi:hypothetical protein